jgi:DNA repair protein RecN (Recombination protein N)
MLAHLSVENYVLIDKLEIDFHPGMTIITGETGAGKSILLGALSLILGQRADTQVLLDKKRKCIVEAVFNIKDYDLQNFFKDHELDEDEQAIIRREINPQGKSRAFINDTPVTLSILKDLTERMIDIHSQHRILDINDALFQTSVIDSFAKQQAQVKKYREEFFTYKELEKRLAELEEQEKQSRADQDYYQFQFDELDQVRLVNGEQEELESELNILSNAESIKDNFQKILLALNESEDNILVRLAALQQLLSQVARYDTASAGLSDRLNSQYIELKDLVQEIELRSLKVTVNPARLEEISNRLDTIYRLQQKHRVTSVAELIEIKSGVEEKLLRITSLENLIVKVKADVQSQNEELKRAAEGLHKGREKAIPTASAKLTAMLKSLGMPDARIQIECISSGRFHALGSDNIRFLFNANKGGELNELSHVASGGELSRLMLSVKSLVSQKNLLPTIIFDEIDSGVSGEVASKVAEILFDLSRNMQVLAITHLPQIAARGKNHLLVYKKSGAEATHTFIRQLSEKEREVEIAQMIGGLKYSGSTLATARELMARK